MAPAASTAVDPSGMVHARVSSGPAVKNEIRPEQPIGQPDDALEARLRQAEVGAEHGRFFGLELADFHLDAPRQRLHLRLAVLVARGEIRDKLRRRARRLPRRC